MFINIKFFSNKLIFDENKLVTLPMFSYVSFCGKISMSYLVVLINILVMHNSAALLAGIALVMTKIIDPQKRKLTCTNDPTTTCWINHKRN